MLYARKKNNLALTKHPAEPCVMDVAKEKKEKQNGRPRYCYVDLHFPGMFNPHILKLTMYFEMANDFKAQCQLTQKGSSFEKSGSTSQG